MHTMTRPLPLLLSASLLLVAGEGRAQEDLLWLKAPAKAPTITSFTSTSPVVNGNASTLTVNVTGADTCSIDQGVGSVSCAGGTASVSPSTTTTYTLTATKKSKTSTATAGVTVLGLLRQDANTLLHVVFDGSGPIDGKSNTITTTGAVPQVAPSGAVPAGAGPFSDANYYTVAVAGLNAATNMTGVVIFKATSLTNNPIITSAGVGYAEVLQATGRAIFGGGGLTTINSASTGQFVIVCFGRAGTTAWIQMNNGSAASAANTPALTSTVYVGRYSSTSFALSGTVYEVLYGSAAASAAVCQAWIDQAHAVSIGWPW